MKRIIWSGSFLAAAVLFSGPALSAPWKVELLAADLEAYGLNDHGAIGGVQTIPASEDPGCGTTPPYACSPSYRPFIYEGGSVRLANGYAGPQVSRLTNAYTMTSVTFSPFGPSHGFVVRNQSVEEIASPFPVSSPVVNAQINNKGQLLVTYGAEGLLSSQLRTPGSASVDLPGVGTLLNDAGQVVFSSSDGAHYLYDGGTTTALTTAQGHPVQATHLTDSGVISGIRVDGAQGPGPVLGKAGQLEELPTLGGRAQINDVNEKGEAVGFSYLGGNQNAHAVLYRNGVPIDLGTLGGAFSFASAINDAGQVIGFSQTQAGDAYHLFFYDGVSMHDLQSENPALAGKDILTSRVFLNEAGQIAGMVGEQGSYTRRPFLMTQVPEPAAGALAISGLSLLAVAMRRRRLT